MQITGTASFYYKLCGAIVSPRICRPAESNLFEFISKSVWYRWNGFWTISYWNPGTLLSRPALTLHLLISPQSEGGRCLRDCRRETLHWRMHLIEQCNIDSFRVLAPVMRLHCITCLLHRPHFLFEAKTLEHFWIFMPKFLNHQSHLTCCSHRPDGKPLAVPSTYLHAHVHWPWVLSILPLLKFDLLYLTANTYLGELNAFIMIK